MGLGAGGVEVEVEVEVGGGGGRGLPGDGSVAAVWSVSSWENFGWMAGLLGGSLHGRGERAMVSQCRTVVSIKYDK